MDDLRQMQIFAAVVQCGSMSGAARLLQLTPSAVSQQIKALEQRAGVTLLLRTTRSLSLTDVGERFHAACVAMVTASERARAELESERNAPVGVLRISAPVGFARHLQTALRELIEANAALRLLFMLNDERRDLVSSRIDLGFAFGSLRSSDWSSRRVGGFDFWLCASPDYLCRHPAPTRPEELIMHHWLNIGTDSAERKFTLAGPDGVTDTATIASRITANNQQAIEIACLGGLGIARLSSLDVHSHVASGRLVRLLPKWTAGTYDIWALTPKRDLQPAKVRLAVDAVWSYLHRAAGARA